MKNWMIRNVSDEVRKDIKVLAAKHECTIPEMLETLVDWYIDFNRPAVDRPDEQS